MLAASGAGGAAAGRFSLNFSSLPRACNPLRPCAQHAGPVWRVFVQLSLRYPARKALMASECAGLCAERD
jgi:hypothetical protein